MLLLLGCEPWGILSFFELGSQSTLHNRACHSPGFRGARGKSDRQNQEQGDILVNDASGEVRLTGFGC
jgi:hypothetical protein